MKSKQIKARQNACKISTEGKAKSKKDQTRSRSRGNLESDRNVSQAAKQQGIICTQQQSAQMFLAYSVMNAVFFSRRRNVNVLMQDKSMIQVK